MQIRVSSSAYLLPSHSGNLMIIVLMSKYIIKQQSTFIYSLAYSKGTGEEQEGVTRGSYEETPIPKHPGNSTLGRRDQPTYPVDYHADGAAVGLYAEEQSEVQ